MADTNSGGVFVLQEVRQRILADVWPKTIQAPQASYDVVASAENFNEDGSVTFTINTSGVANDTTLYWTIQNITSSSGLFGGVTSGSVVVSNNTALVNIDTSIVNDSRFSDSPSTYDFVFQVRTNSVSGEVVASSNTISVNNTWGSRMYSTAGGHTFIVPSGVTSISFAAIGGGGGGGVGSENFGAGAGGACAYRNNVAVTPGQSITVVVGVGGAGAPSTLLNSDSAGNLGSSGGPSYVTVNSVSTIAGGGSGGQGGSNQSNGGTISGTTSGGGAGGKGGAKLAAGGGGGGGFTGAGGDGARWWSPAVSATAGSGGGGGGGGSGRVNTTTSSSARGGFGGSGGAQTNGAAGTNTTTIGSGNNGGTGSSTFASAGGGAGAYGGNSGATVSGATANPGAVLIVWPGTRQFPSTNILPF
jgi:hypothetical protein